MITAEEARGRNTSVFDFVDRKIRHEVDNGGYLVRVNVIRFGHESIEECKRILISNGFDVRDSYDVVVDNYDDGIGYTCKIRMLTISW